MSRLKLDENELVLTIRSPLEWWYSHWEPSLGRSRRCPGPQPPLDGQVQRSQCRLCIEGRSDQIRFVLAVELENGEVRFLELLERQEAFLTELNESHEHGQIGAVVRIRKLWRAANAPIDIELIDRRTVVPIQMSRFAKSLGLPPLMQ